MKNTVARLLWRKHVLPEAALNKDAFDRLALFAKRDIGDNNASAITAP